MSKRIVIRAEYARLIQPYLSKEETRYYLQGFHVEPAPTKGVFIIGTDGHKMGCFYDAEGVCDAPAIVRLDRWMVGLLKESTREKRDTSIGRYLLVEAEEKRASVYWGSPLDGGRFIASQGDTIVDGTFPDWRRVIPVFQTTGLHAPMLKLENLAALLSSPKAADKDSPAGMFRAFAKGDADPVYVVTGRTDFVGIFMPMRDTPTAQFTLPTWFPAPHPPAKTEKSRG